MVKIYACKNATNNSITLINTVNGTATIAITKDLKINIKEIIYVV